MARNRLLEETPEQRRARDMLRDAGERKNHPLDLPEALRAGPFQRWREDMKVSSALLFGFVVFPIFLVWGLFYIFRDLFR